MRVHVSLRCFLATACVGAGCAGARGPATPDPEGCSSARGCEGLEVCIPPISDSLNCGPMDCDEVVLACASDDRCAPGWECHLYDTPERSPVGAPGRCEPRSCESDDGCGDPNFACDSGACRPRPCDLDQDCAGYCLPGQSGSRGICYPTPGVCASTAPRA